MKIDARDFERIMKKADKPVDKKKIIDFDKYYYWNTKADELLNKCIEYKDDKEKHLEYLHQSLIATLERNEYFRMGRKDMMLFWISIKYHNAKYPDKLYIDRRGRRVKKHDRRAIRNDAYRI